MASANHQHDVFNLVGSPGASIFVNDVNSTNEFERRARQEQAEKERREREAKQADELAAGLPRSFHDQIVQMVTTCASRKAIDFGGTEGETAIPYVWNYGYNYKWQKLRLNRVDPDDPQNFLWTICAIESGVYMEINGDRAIVAGKERLADSQEKKRQEWFITFNDTKTAFMVHSEAGDYLQLQNATSAEIKTQLQGGDRSNQAHVDGQLWHLVPQ